MSFTKQRDYKDWNCQKQLKVFLYNTINDVNIGAELRTVNMISLGKNCLVRIVILWIHGPKVLSYILPILI